MTYELPHLLDRPGQQDALDWIMNSKVKYNILRAPTGFGKSPLAAATSIEFRTLALVLHKSLQSANYRDQYDFDILYGKANYPCIKRNEIMKLQKFTAYDCGNPHCDCPYQKQEISCLSSLRVSLNYAKFLMSSQFSELYKPEYLFLDEAHNLPNIVTNFVGLTLDWDNEFLQAYGRIQPKINERLDYNMAMSLFRQCARSVDDSKPDQKEDLTKWRKWKRLHTKIQSTNQILSFSLKDWYYETDDKKLTIKPLTAKYHFKKLFGVADKVILMSATIGPIIAERLGLEDDEWEYHEVANSWPAPSRLVYDLGGPAMNYNSSEADKQIHAELIASVLSPNKSGVIHTMSKTKGGLSAQNILNRLSSLVGSDINIYMPKSDIGTDGQLDGWNENRKPGTYCVGWSFHEGVDFGEDDINITAKIPWKSLASNYEKAAMEYDQQWYNVQAAMKFEQTCGRIRRGKNEHYLPGAKMVYIADSSWHRLKTLLSDDFRKSIRRYNGI